MTLKHVQTILKDGKLYRYLRIPGQPRLRLPDTSPDDPDFLAAYAAAMATVKTLIRAPQGTIKAMAEGYLRSPAFKGLSTSYRALLRRHIDAITDQAEDAKAAHLRPSHIQADLAPLLPNVAGHRLKAWRAICRHGLESGLIPDDPSRAVTKKRAPKTMGHVAWILPEVEAFRAAYPIGTAVRAVFEVLHWTGARISDVVMIGPGHVSRDGVLAFTQTKTGSPAYVPWTCPLPKKIRTMITDRDMMHAAIAPFAGHMTFLATQGHSRSHKAAGHLISNAAHKLGIPKSAHGLRKYRATALRDAGANVYQIAAWTGHESLEEVTYYTKSADRRRAVIGMEQGQNTVNSNDLSCKLVEK